MSRTPRHQAIGDVIGGFVISSMADPDRQYGARAYVRCSVCGVEYLRTLAQLRNVARRYAELGRTGPHCFACTRERLQTSVPKVGA